VPQQPAAILIQRDKPYPDRQRVMCQRYAEKHDYRVVAIGRRWADCYVMVVNRVVAVVICATDPGVEVGERIEAAGGQLRVVRRGGLPQPRLRRDVAGLVARMRIRGYDTAEIAGLLDIDARDVRRRKMPE
jgi:hypothetical protein